MRKPNNDGRNSDGRFASGNKLGGNRAGSRHRVTRAIEALLEGQHEVLTAKAVELALDGDTTALRLCLDRLAPPKKDSPLSLDLPLVRSAKDAVDASSMVLAAVSAGEITPDEAGRVMALLSAHNEIIEAGDHETRIAELEKRLEEQRSRRGA
ncbi:hypothetical protein [Aurantiacibacter arachoides]|uniref:hypothetical protein n=1 Tax=Aurantiacibacter arachoides TaxID=1850444 RepID=UPI0019902D35|nr:hypothetical protein [Aurantiacibacter arachoides]GGD50726.1 hypothetical protein GCM10011411_08260 [Aurantiacibacter arachoides]